MTGIITFKNRRGSQLLACLAIVIAWVLTLAPSASAVAPPPFEQVQTWAGGKESPLKAAVGLAVNVSGVGGVAPGTVYAVSSAGQLLTYGSKGEFIKEKQIGKNGGFDSRPLSIAIDQANGNVYVLLKNGSTEPSVVEVFSPNASTVVTTFGHRSPPSAKKTIDETPDNVHEPNSIAVDESGTVYISDEGYAEAEPGGLPRKRIMVWKPGIFEYEYAGRANDVAVGAKYGNQRIALDSSGSNIYLASDESVFRFNLSSPDTPNCEGEVVGGGLQAMTINPDTGMLFYDSYKDGKGHQLVCSGAGEFENAGEPFKISPRPTAFLSMEALAFNPDLAYSPERPAGTLYGANETGVGFIFAQAAVHEPVVENQSVSGVTATSAVLGAYVRPENVPTTYVFQYLTEAEYEANDPTEPFAGADEVPNGGGLAGGGPDAVAVSAPLSGLLPEMEYRFRAVATSHCAPDPEEVCEAIGPSDTFRTFPIEPPGLPDDRGYELVSPVEKQGGEVFPADPITSSCGGQCKPGKSANRFPLQSSTDGNSVVYEGYPFSDQGAVLENEYISKRTESGWETTTLSSQKMTTGNEQGYKAFDATLSEGVVYQNDNGLSPQAPSGYRNLYTQGTASPSVLTPLLTQAPSREAPQFAMRYAGASADFKRLYFEANGALTGETGVAPAAEDGGAPKNNLYEWANGQLTLVNVEPGNLAAPAGAAFGAPEHSLTKANLTHAISADGSRVFWTSEAGQVYVRIDAELTEAIPDAGGFLAASADGSRLLLSNGHLYNVDELAEPPVDLTSGLGGFKGVLGQSEDLSGIYFADSAALAPGAETRSCTSAPANPGRKEEEEGKVASGFGCNLYRWENGTVSFVAALLGVDKEDWSASPVQRTAEASPNGNWLAFASSAQLTGYDNTGPSCLADSGTGKFKFGVCEEAFVYNSSAEELICTSCNPSNAQPIGGATLRRFEGAKGWMPQPHYLTDEGRLVFDSRDSLVARDSNGGVEDVYEYEPGGVGTCLKAGGCVSLISAGDGEVDSNFLAMDPSGKNVFFTTRDRLTGRDRDDLIDLYDAREGGGIEEETETLEPECQGESCQPVPAVPNDPTPASSTFEGSGNVVEKSKKPKHKKHQRKKQRKHKKAAAKHKSAAGKGGSK